MKCALSKISLRIAAWIICLQSATQKNEQRGRTHCSSGRSYLLFLAIGFGLRKSTAGNALGFGTVTVVFQNRRCFACNGLAGLLGVCHVIPPFRQDYNYNNILLALCQTNCQCCFLRKASEKARYCCLLANKCQQKGRNHKWDFIFFWLPAWAGRR